MVDVSWGDPIGSNQYCVWILRLCRLRVDSIVILRSFGLIEWWEELWHDIPTVALAISSSSGMIFAIVHLAPVPAAMADAFVIGMGDFFTSWVCAEFLPRVATVASTEAAHAGIGAAVQVAALDFATVFDAPPSSVDLVAAINRARANLAVLVERALDRACHDCIGAPIEVANVGHGVEM
ncbi:hypothetical protein AC1031_014359 [Aphanomyces cochlioides]|nr:hypothetical protein AC1031_014359 [Aphanomyces cochlioides]